MWSVSDDGWSLPRLRSRPKFLSDQIFQTEIISDQNFQVEINPEETFQTQVASDQTFQTQRVSDQTFQSEGVLIRQSSDHGPDSNSDHSPDRNHTMIRLEEVLIRLNCAGNSLIRERFYLWTNLLNLLPFNYFIKTDVCSI